MNLSREITKLRRTAARLAGGENIQITALMPVARMADSRERAARFLAFLVRRSHAHFKNGRSLARTTVISDEQKDALYGMLLTGIAGPQNRASPQGAGPVTEIRDILNSLDPGWIRLHIHASRRRLEEPDLVLMETVARRISGDLLNGWDCYFASQYYCCDYHRLRFKPDRRSAGRVNEIADFFGRFHCAGDSCRYY